MDYPWNTINTDYLNVSNNTDIDGTLNVDGLATLNSLSLTNKLDVSQIQPGSVSQILSTSGGVPMWTSVSVISASQEVSISAQNANAASSNTLSFSNTLTNHVSSFGPTSYSLMSVVGVGPTYTQLLVNFTGTYKFSPQIRIPNPLLGSSQTAFALVVNSVTQSPRLDSSLLPTLTTGNNSIVGCIIISLNSGDVISFLCERVNGSGAMNIEAANSRVYIELLSVLS